MKVQELITAPLGQIKTVFQQLPPAEEQSRSGFYRASFIGPAWLRATAGPSLALSGLKGWQGKRFLSADTATNILKNKDQTTEKLTMTCESGISAVDGKQGVALTYPKNAPLPWRWVVDEMRQLDDNTLLCMTVFNLPILKHFPVPFILTKEGDK